MAPTETSAYSRLFPRYYCNAYDNGCQHWNGWGRWAVLGVAIFVFILVMVCCSVMSRRRRRRGVQPFYGTGWMGGPPKYGAQNTYSMNNYGGAGGGGQGYNAPPAYGQQAQPQWEGPTGGNNNANAGPTHGGYYGGNQDSGIQQPSHVYGRGDDYSPPSGPPPGKY